MVIPVFSSLARLNSAARLPLGLSAMLAAPLSSAADTPLPFSAASTPLASQLLQAQWDGLAPSKALDWRYSFVSTPLIRQQMAARANRVSAELELIAARYAATCAMARRRFASPRAWWSEPARRRAAW